MSQTSGSTLTEYLIDQQPGLAVVLRQKIGSQNTHYVHGLRGIASQHDGAGWSDAIADGLGSVRGWLNGSQAFVSDVNYNPYGVPDASVDGFGFTGEMTDDNGLVYLRARYYDPTVGVFASLDPFKGTETIPMSLNRYSWVEGNVANWTDASGLSPLCLSQQICNGIQDKNIIETLGCLTVTPEKCCGYDVSSWFLEELRIHKEFVVNQIRSLRWSIGGFEIPYPPYEMELLLDFRNYARAIPYKWMRFDMPNLNGHSNKCPSDEQCIRGVTLCGKCIDRSELGNIMYGWAGSQLGISPILLWRFAIEVGALRGAAENVAAGIGVYLSSQTFNTVDSMCQNMRNANGTFVNLPGATWQWDWDIINSGQNPDISQCAPCQEMLPSDYPHTIPSTDGTLAGRSRCADSSNCSGNPNDAFYVTQIPSSRYLAPELCNNATIYWGLDAVECGTVYPIQYPPGGLPEF